jgi:peptidoglycan/xylan/chitin deacetylase (PgdA/CDA1 family)
VLARDERIDAVVLNDCVVQRPLSRGALARAELEPDLRDHAIRRILAEHRRVIEGDPRAILLGRERVALAALARHRTLTARRDAAVAAIRSAEDDARRLEGFLRGHDRLAIDWGELRSTVPVSRDWGYDRGLPVDRVLIEQFIAEHAGHIRGRVLEVQEADLTRRFGGNEVTRSDVVDIEPANRNATILADLRHAAGIPSETYDCIILTQTLHVIDDMPAVVRECFRILKPGGTLLATLPCASRACLEYGTDGDFWRATAAGARHLFAPVFGDAALAVRELGNVLTTTAFLQGLAAHEISPAEYAESDAFNTTVNGVRAVKSQSDPVRPVHGMPHRRRGRAVVLLYHRVGSPGADPHELAIPATSFEAQMASIASRFLPATLDDLLDAAARGHLPHQAVAVTFDDGYRDNLREAVPVLERYGVPASFFVTTAPLGEKRPFWWDVLAGIFAVDSEPPRELDMQVGATRIRMPTATATERAAAHDVVYRLMVRLDRCQIDRAVDILQAWSGISAEAAASYSAPMGRDELIELAASSARTIGAHGADHLYLPTQPDATRRSEIAGSRRALEDLLGRDVRWFAYPFGAFDDECCRAVQRAGFDGALTCEPRALAEGEDLYRVPRLEVRCRSASELEAQLRALLDA